MTNKEIKALENVCCLAKNWTTYKSWEEDTEDLIDLNVAKSWKKDIDLVKKIITREMKMTDTFEQEMIEEETKKEIKMYEKSRLKNSPYNILKKFSMDGILFIYQWFVKYPNCFIQQEYDNNPINFTESEFERILINVIDDLNDHFKKKFVIFLRSSRKYPGSAPDPDDTDAVEHCECYGVGMEYYDKEEIVTFEKEEDLKEFIIKSHEDPNIIIFKIFDNFKLIDFEVETKVVFT